MHCLSFITETVWYRHTWFYKNNCSWIWCQCLSEWYACEKLPAQMSTSSYHTLHVPWPSSMKASEMFVFVSAETSIKGQPHWHASNWPSFLPIMCSSSRWHWLPTRVIGTSSSSTVFNSADLLNHWMFLDWWCCRLRTMKPWLLFMYPSCNTGYSEKQSISYCMKRLELFHARVMCLYYSKLTEKQNDKNNCLTLLHTCACRVNPDLSIGVFTASHTWLVAYLILMGSRNHIGVAHSYCHELLLCVQCHSSLQSAFRVSRTLTFVIYLTKPYVGMAPKKMVATLIVNK